jgi:hypothetical protein
MSLRNRNQYPAQVRQEFEHFDRRIVKLQTSFSYVPVGSRVLYDGPVPPDGWLFSDGSELQRTRYVALFRVLGVKYGGGANTFFLPSVSDEIIFTGVV